MSIEETHMFVLADTPARDYWRARQRFCASHDRLQRMHGGADIEVCLVSWLYDYDNTNINDTGHSTGDFWPHTALSDPECASRLSVSVGNGRRHVQPSTPLASLSAATVYIRAPSISPSAHISSSCRYPAGQEPLSITEEGPLGRSGGCSVSRRVGGWWRRATSSPWPWRGAQHYFKSFVVTVLDRNCPPKPRGNKVFDGQFPYWWNCAGTSSLLVTYNNHQCGSCTHSCHVPGLCTRDRVHPSNSDSPTLNINIMTDRERGLQHFSGCDQCPQLWCTDFWLRRGGRRRGGPAELHLLLRGCTLWWLWVIIMIDSYPFFNSHIRSIISVWEGVGQREKEAMLSMWYAHLCFMFSFSFSFQYPAFVKSCLALKHINIMCYSHLARIWRSVWHMSHQTGELVITRISMTQ